MKDIMDSVADLDAAAAHTIAAAMREVSRVDGVHPNEEILIDEFEQGLPAGSSDVDLGTIRTDAAKEAFLKSCVLVAFADGALTDAELGVIGDYAGQLGLGADDITKATRDVASALLSQFADVTTFRAQVVQIGRDMGLDDEAIEAALSN